MRLVACEHLISGLLQLGDCRTSAELLELLDGATQLDFGEPCAKAHA